jgi:hypothetical protein
VKTAPRTEQGGFVAKVSSFTRPESARSLGSENLPRGSSQDWLTPLRFAFLLGLLIFACFPQVLLGLESFAYGDAGQFAYPVAFYHRESFWRGELPMWNPLNSCGIPFLAQWNTLTLYPPSLFYILLPLPWSFSVFCLGHIFLAGMGMYFLAYRWSGNRFAASVAGAVFCFNGLTWYGVMWPHLLAALAWMPWLVLHVDRAWQYGRQAILVAAVIGAVQLLSGGAEVILQTWMVVGLLFILRLVTKGTSLWRLLARTSAVCCLAGGLAAAQLLPFLDLLLHSQRDAGYSNGGVGTIATMPFTGWVNYVVPLFHCARNPAGVFGQVGQTWTGSYYLGIGIIFLALFAICGGGRTKLVWTLAGLTVFSCLIALGAKGVVYTWVHTIFPLLGFIRFPVKFLYLATFALPILAGFGLQRLTEAPDAGWPLERRKIRALFLALVGLSAAISWHAWQFPLGETAMTTLLANVIVRLLFLSTIIFFISLLRRQDSLKSQRLLQTGLIVLLWFDVFTHSSNLSPTVPSAALRADMVRAFFKWDNQPGVGSARAMESKAAFWTMLSTTKPGTEDDLAGRRLALFMNLNLLDHTSKLDGFYSLDLGYFLDVFKNLYFTTNEASGLKDFLGISQVSDPTNIVSWVPRASFLPLVTAGQAPEFCDDASAMAKLVSPSFDARRIVYLPNEAQSVAKVTQPAKVKLVSTRFSQRRVRVELESDTPAMVVISQSFYHAWHAYVDGRKTALWRANYAFQALEVGPGTHTVDVVYEDEAFRLGALASVCSLLIIGSLAVLWRTQGRPCAFAGIADLRYGRAHPRNPRNPRSKSPRSTSHVTDETAVAAGRGRAWPK